MMSFIVMLCKQFVKLTFFSLQLSKISWRKFFPLFQLKDTITPQSTDCVIAIILGGRNFTLTPSHCNKVMVCYRLIGELFQEDHFFWKFFNHGIPKFFKKPILKKLKIHPSTFLVILYNWWRLKVVIFQSTRFRQFSNN